jgi:hypothetical protein
MVRVWKGTQFPLRHICVQVALVFTTATYSVSYANSFPSGVYTKHEADNAVKNT